MRRARPLRFGLKALRRDRRLFASLATLILAFQLFAAGLAGGAMAAADAHHAGRPVLCTAAGEAFPEPSRTGDPSHGPEHSHDCPCLSAGSCCPAPGLLPSNTIAVPGLVARHVDSPSLQPEAEEPDRRPMRLFGRAGRSPPLPS